MICIIENPLLTCGYSSIILQPMISRVILREELEYKVRTALHRSPVVTLLGPRQCGKTTLAKRIAAGGSSHYFDLENPIDRSRLASPLLNLSPLKGLVVIDEAQREPSLFPILRVLVDRQATQARFLVLGSASPGIVKGVSESLAGRNAFIEMSGFSLPETGDDSLQEMWFRGGFPRSFLSESDSESAAWREDFIRAFLERDIPQLGITIPAITLRRFWTMVAHYHGNVWNAAEFARSLGTSEGTARRYLDIITGTFLIRQLPPWFENLSKRQVKSPKVYVRDSGILHSLLAVGGRAAFSGHPKYGASWEGFVIEQILAVLDSRNAYFWSTYSGAELDLFLLWNGKRIGFEMKCADAPGTSKSLVNAAKDLSLDALYVVYPGTVRYRITEKIEAVPLPDVFDFLGKG